MTWECFLTTEEESRQGDDWPVIGAMWELKLPTKEDTEGWNLSDEYWSRIYPKRGPLIVMLPGYVKDGDGNIKIHGWPWCVDSKQSNPPHTGWTITGEAPKITVNPSINAIGSYHGYIRDGVITDGPPDNF